MGPFEVATRELRSFYANPHNLADLRRCLADPHINGPWDTSHWVRIFEYFFGTRPENKKELVKGKLRIVEYDPRWETLMDMGILKAHAIVLPEVIAKMATQGEEAA